MNTNLVVVRPFGGLARGALITDPVRASAILAGENRFDVVRVGADPAPPAKTAPAEGI
jgi:hypothetical protein